ncbi:hypothetical protein M2480_002267 [Parabacteroides sp. PFB2-12]|uniref:eCIS core domain-containing protein n=1 Tax=unclassified Parabacteroides TaxID=2649774 RepID=UPI00247416E9|nr:MULTISPECIES: DUF4157 domain-containing protein [unclassified Parabacteroides]MDH6343914.1 hypothetical protein [Parabacteroides sp. PM6-13]MDH6391276.1 hypothetical protein [Parabacteroides sp. PFB2-12]
MKTQEKKPEAVSHTLQAKSGKTHQPPATAVLQAYKEGVIQREANEEEEPLQMKNNQTGLPDNLKSGVEALSGYSMDDVRVHFNSSQPAQFQALAYTQGTNIHVAPGQEQHLAHEAWHVVQQKQGRVQPTMQMKGINVNDDEGLEREADEMGMEAMSGGFSGSLQRKAVGNQAGCMQRRPIPQGPRNRNVSNFIKQKYSKNYNNGLGHFNALYNPKAKTLNITLPVHFPVTPGVQIATEEGRAIFDGAMPPTYKAKFKEAVRDKWSRKHLITTTAERNSAETGSNLWQSKLNPVTVYVTVEEKANPGESYFSIKHNNSIGFSNVSQSDSGEGTVHLAEGAYHQTLISQNPQDPRVNPYMIKLGDKFNTYAHEAGHMFGLDDEYQVREDNFSWKLSDGGFKAYDEIARRTVEQPNTNKYIRFNFRESEFMLIDLDIFKETGFWENTSPRQALIAPPLPIPSILGNTPLYYSLNNTYYREHSRFHREKLNSSQTEWQHPVTDQNISLIERNRGFINGNIQSPITILNTTDGLLYCNSTNVPLMLWKKEGNLWSRYNDPVENKQGDYSAIRGFHTTHHALTSQIIGENYANLLAVMDNELLWNDSLMAAGEYIRRRHYVTFVDALVQGIQIVYKVAEDQDPNAPNQVEDWTIG